MTQRRDSQTLIEADVAPADISRQASQVLVEADFSALTIERRCSTMFIEVDAQFPAGANPGVWGWSKAQ